jgi:transposase
MNRHTNKRQALLEAGALHADPERVRAPLFDSHPFFDPKDKAQVKYEMLRARELEGEPLEQTCRRFGFTRESYRQILERFRAEGMFGLFDRKRGRKNPLKIDNKVRMFLCNEHTRMPELGADELAARCEKETGVSLSRRSVYRVLSKLREEKKKRHRKVSSEH